MPFKGIFLRYLQLRSDFKRAYSDLRNTDKGCGKASRLIEDIAKFQSSADKIRIMVYQLAVESKNVWGSCAELARIGLEIIILESIIIKRIEEDEEKVKTEFMTLADLGFPTSEFNRLFPNFETFPKNITSALQHEIDNAKVVLSFERSSESI